MAISRSQMRRQLQNRGGITNVSPRQHYGLGSSLKKFVRKVIPNEVSKVATATAPFVAPFNPALAGAMAGLGSFDQTGSLSDAFKRGALTYGGGQAARYIGGAGFQGNPFTEGGAFTSGGFMSGFSSPLGTETGLGKIMADRRMPVGSNTEIDLVSEVQPLGQDIAEKGILSRETALAGMPVGGADPGVYISPSEYNRFSKAALDTEKANIVQRIKRNPSIENIGKEAVDLAKKGAKAVFLDDKGNLDKSVLLGTIAFTASYAEAKGLADEVGVELTEAEYDETKKADKQEEYAANLKNFFEGRKDGGRIGFANGTGTGSGKFALINTPQLNEDITMIEKIKDFAGDAVEKLGEEAVYKFNEFVYNEPALYGFMANNYDSDTLQNPKAREELRTFYDTLNPKKKEYIEMYLDSIAYPDDDSYKDWLFSKPSKISFPTDERMREHNKQFDFLPYNKDAYSIRAKTDKDLPMKADGGRIGLREGTGSKKKYKGSKTGIKQIDPTGFGLTEESYKYKGGIGGGASPFSKAAIAFLFKTLGKTGGVHRKYTMPELRKILNNPGKFPKDETVLKEILKIKGFFSGGIARLGFDNGGVSSIFGNPDQSEYEKFMKKRSKNIINFENNLAKKLKNKYDLDSNTARKYAGTINFYVNSNPRMLSGKEKILEEGYLGNNEIILKEIENKDNINSFAIERSKGGIARLASGGRIKFAEGTDTTIANIPQHRDVAAYLRLKDLLDKDYYFMDSKDLDNLNTMQKERFMYDYDPKKSGILEQIKEIFVKEDEGGGGGGDPFIEGVEQMYVSDAAGVIPKKGGGVLPEDIGKLTRDDFDYEEDYKRYLNLTRKNQAQGSVPTGILRSNKAGVIERDYRTTGGFVPPIGIKEKADDIPAMLSNNEFVMTADAVRGIGGGSVEKGSEKLYNVMKQAEQVGKA